MSHNFLNISGQLSNQDLTDEPRGHRLLQRMSSYPKTHPDLDPHRYDLQRGDANDLEAVSVAGLRQLPNIPPTSYFWQQNQEQSNTQPRRSPRSSRSPVASTNPASDFHKRPSRNFSHNSFSAISSKYTGTDILHTGPNPL